MLCGTSIVGSLNKTSKKQKKTKNKKTTLGEHGDLLFFVLFINS